MRSGPNHSTKEGTYCAFLLLRCMLPGEITGAQRWLESAHHPMEKSVPVLQSCWMPHCCTDQELITLILRSPLHSKLTFWNAKTGVELCSNHWRYGIPTPPNHHVEQSHAVSCWQSLQVLQCWWFTKQSFGIKVKCVQFHLLGAGRASPIW